MISWYASLLACVKAPSMVIPKPPPIWIWGQRQGRTGGGLLKIWDTGKSAILAIGTNSCGRICLSKIWYNKHIIVIDQSQFWKKKKSKIFNFQPKWPFWPISWISRIEPKYVRPPLFWAFLGKTWIIRLILGFWESYETLFFRFGAK